MLIGTVSPLEKTAVGAEPPPSGLRDVFVCSDLESDVERLKCYDDEAVQRGVRRGKDSDAAAADVVRPPSLMGRRWELDPGTEHGLFSIRPHKQVYLLPGPLYHQCEQPTVESYARHDSSVVGV